MILAFQIGFLDISWKDVLDILLVTFLLAQVYKLMKGSVAIKVFVGFLSIYLIYLVVNALQMELLSTILGQFMGVGVLAVIILFQQEIRKFLLLVGRTNIFEEGNLIKNLRFWTQNGKTKRANITPIVEAVKSLAGSNTGALIVLSEDSPLKFYAESGDAMDSLLSKRLLLAIFNKYSPLHDGAVIVHKDRIVAARCILPVTERDVPAQYGLRHRAGLGMSENTETFIIVVSEETGQISAMQNGETMHNISAQELRRQINKYLNEPKELKKEKEKKEKEKEISSEVEVKEEVA
ncbi:TIGR00159 family protein [Ekhidna lutea]|uniref:Diadenylate cyclase n=1 Tax=Ekhidna lutea TaxID=447679 RepID=A0A239IXK0_EKHLU|nr:diadenylate cyclase CdaA [Ekhidna lutea]SNS97134.1 TIGR00159 family protein [Ekhidna lutea]